MKNRLATLGLVAFLAVDVMLVWLALRPATPSGQPTTPLTAAPATATSTTTGATTSTTPSGTSSTSARTTAPPEGTPVSTLVAALDASTAWRGKSGSCDRGGATLEVTSDGGSSWTPVTSPARALSRIQPLDTKSVFVIGAAADCAIKEYASSDSGDTWKAPRSVSGGWARRLDDPTTVVTPKDPESQACGGAVVLDLSRTAATDAQALCASGDVVATTDGGTSWSRDGRATGGLALTNLASGGQVTTYVARIADACKGVQVVRLVDARSTNVACIQATNPKPGGVGISVVTGAAWLVVGRETWVAEGSTLRSWTKV